MKVIRIIFIIFCIIAGVLLLWHFLTRKYLSPYRLTFVFGKKGSGKSTLLAKKALQYLENGWTVFTTEGVPGTYMISPSDIGQFDLPPHSVLFIDEASLAWDNRDFKTMPKSTIEWFRLQRHRKCAVWLFSQTFDVDKKLRDLSDDMWLITKKFRVFSYGKRIIRKTDIVEAVAGNGGESRVVENLQFDSLLFAFFGSRSLTFIPHWVHVFNSFSCEKLKEKEYELIPLRDDLIKRYKSYKRFVSRHK